MGLPRKDARTTMEDEIHGQLTVYAEQDGLTVAEYIENLIVKDVTGKTRKAIEAVERLTSLGIIRKNPDTAGKP